MCTHILEPKLLISWCIWGLCLGAGVPYQALSQIIPEVQGNSPRSVCSLPFMAFNDKSIMNCQLHLMKRNTTVLFHCFPDTSVVSEHLMYLINPTHVTIVIFQQWKARHVSTSPFLSCPSSPNNPCLSICLQWKFREMNSRQVSSFIV